jgi:hypothetical protein
MAMTIEECLVAYLKTVAPLTALVGGGFWPDVAPQNVDRPYVEFGLMDERGYITQSGASSLRKALYQFDIWGDSNKDVTNVKKQMRLALDGFMGTMGDQSGINCIFDKAARTRDAETKAFCVSMRFNIFYHDES